MLLEPSLAGAIEAPNLFKARTAPGEIHLEGVAGAMGGG